MEIYSTRHVYDAYISTNMNSQRYATYTHAHIYMHVYMDAKIGSSTCRLVPMVR